MASLFEAIKKANGLARKLTKEEKVVGPTMDTWMQEWEKNPRMLVREFDKEGVSEKGFGWKWAWRIPGFQFAENPKQMTHHPKFATSFRKVYEYGLPRGLSDKDIQWLKPKLNEYNPASSEDKLEGSRRWFRRGREAGRFPSVEEIQMDPTSYIDHENDAVREYASQLIQGSL